MDTVSTTTLLELIAECPETDVEALLDEGRLILVGVVVNADFH